MTHDVVWNVRLKLAASGLNGVATAAFGLGLLAPLAASMYGTGSLRPNPPAWLTDLIWLFGGLAMHFVAQAVLERLRG